MSRNSPKVKIELSDIKKTIAEMQDYLMNSESTEESYRQPLGQDSDENQRQRLLQELQTINKVISEEINNEKLEEYIN